MVLFASKPPRYFQIFRGTLPMDENKAAPMNDAEESMLVGLGVENVDSSQFEQKVLQDAQLLLDEKEEGEIAEQVTEEVSPKKTSSRRRVPKKQKVC